MLTSPSCMKTRKSTTKPWETLGLHRTHLQQRHRVVAKGNCRWAGQNRKDHLPVENTKWWVMLPSTQACVSGYLAQNHTTNNIEMTLASHIRIWQVVLVKSVTIKRCLTETAKAQGQADRYAWKADLPLCVGYISSELCHLGKWFGLSTPHCLICKNEIMGEPNRVGVAMSMKLKGLIDGSFCISRIHHCHYDHIFRKKGPIQQKGIPIHLAWGCCQNFPCKLETG